MTWMTAGRWASAGVAGVSGAATLWLAGSVPTGVLLTVLAAASAALFSVGLTMGWKALDAFSVALREAQQLPRDERVSFRYNSRRRRAMIAASLALLIAFCAFAAGGVVLLREGGVTAAITPTLIYWSGSFVGVALMVFFGLFREYFTGDDLIAEIRDRVTEQHERARQLLDISRGTDFDAKARDALPQRRVVSGV